MISKVPLILSEAEGQGAEGAFYILLITASVTPVKEKPPS